MHNICDSLARCKLIISMFMFNLCAHNHDQVNKVGLKLRAAIITEVYRKALFVSSTTLSKFSTGQVCSVSVH